MSTAPPTSAHYEPPAEIDYASHRFMAQVDMPTEENFWSETDEYLATCWLWQGKVQPDGQAFVWVKGVRVPIHRFAWLLWKGPVPSGLFARPVACQVKLCLCPHHMQLVAHHNQVKRKLTRKDEQAICLLRRDPDNTGTPWSIRRLADKFEVSPTTIRRVLENFDA